jgi:TonB family protein
MRADLVACRRRTRWTMTASAAFHALLLVWLLTRGTAPSDMPSITEIAWIEPGDLGSAASAPSVPAAGPRTTTGAARSSPNEVRFQRALERGDVSPRPQSTAALDDQINTRLATLQNAAALAPIGPVRTSAPAASWSPAQAQVGSGGSGQAPVALQRGGGTGPPVELVRGAGAGAGTTISAATLPAERGGAEAPAAPAQLGEAAARRTVAGATLAGPIADRRILSHSTPEYPDWAKREGVEGSVTLYFVVRPDGSIKENVLVHKTAGFEDFDDSARTALRVWRFEPLRAGRTGEQWGTITFHFRLSTPG